MVKILTICGSMRFQKEMIKVAERLELEENCLVFQCVYFDENRVFTQREVEILNGLHLKKIEKSDGIFVVNVGGYIGSTTKEEIEYARSLQKEVLFLEPTNEF